MAGNFLAKNKSILLYGASLAFLLFLLKWLEWRFIIFSHALEIYIGAIALLFTGLGIWVTLKFTKPKMERIVVEKEIYLPPEPVFAINQKALQQFSISKRELEVLQLMAEGCSNQQIAERLFVSLNTIKTHAANLFSKLNVSSRTQAIDKGKKIGVLP